MYIETIYVRFLRVGREFKDIIFVFIFGFFFGVWYIVSFLDVRIVLYCSFGVYVYCVVFWRVSFVARV